MTNFNMEFYRREEKMNKCITRKRGSEGVIKISHYYMSEIVRLCLYTIKTTDETNLQNIRSKKILARIQKYLIQTGKNKEIFEKYKVDYALMHTTNLYPTPANLTRLNCIKILKKNQVIQNLMN